MMDIEKPDVTMRLRDYRDRINGILKLVGGKTHLDREEKSRAQALMRDLKERLKEDSARSEAGLNDAERAFFRPAIKEASATINARWSSNPLGGDWSSELYDALGTVTHFLDQLEGAKRQGNDSAGHTR